MSRYSFTSLSSQDFEELIRDLLQAEWGIALEAFKSGRDSGVDLRYTRADDGDIIVQCKHYAVSGFTTLLSHLRVSERSKVEKLQPNRYVVATSVGLTPENKKDIVKLFKPYIRSTADVIGANDIEGLLSRHPEVERTNFKLWLTSTSVIERVFHNAQICQTEFEVERIRRKLPLFVQNQAFPRASDLLDHTGIVIISGVPGIGKTTLAEMLLYSHLEQGYEPVVIKSEIAEAKRLFKANRKQVFYYDDFLGQTFLGDRKEYLGRNEDASIVDFMEMVAETEQARFILTTREHILRNALQLSERLARSHTLSHQCVLEIKDYSYGQKARILYNHLYFSDLPQPYKDAILHDRFFLDIIKHDHFSPRLIEWLSSQTRLRGVIPEEYQNHITNLLGAPHNIWDYAFRNQISSEARNLLVCLYTIGEGTDARDIEPVFTAFHRHSAVKYNRSTASRDFRNALQELDGAFLSYDKGDASYINPSIREFVASVISTDYDLAEDVTLSAVRFKQLVSIWKLAQAHPAKPLAQFVSSRLDLFVDTARRLLDSPSIRWVRTRDRSIRGIHIDTGTEARIEFLLKASEFRENSSMAAIAVEAANKLIESWDREIPDFAAVIDLLGEIQSHPWFLCNGGREIYRSLLDGIMSQLACAGAYEWTQILQFPEGALAWTDGDERILDQAVTNYVNGGVEEEISDCSTLEELSELREYLDDLTQHYDLDFSSEIERIDEDIAEREYGHHDYDEGEGFSRQTTASFQESISDEDIAQMFDSLRENS